MRWLLGLTLLLAPALAQDLATVFDAPPVEARPWVYWYFNDGWLTREGLTADLEAMRRAGLGGGIMLEVNLGLGRGPVPFMSEEWRRLYGHAFAEADRLGLALGIGAGPGWCGTGGPWVKPEQSMQHLVGRETRVTGPAHIDQILPQPAPRTPFFGEGTLTSALHQAWRDFCRDEAVLAFRTPAGAWRLPDVDEKALYYRAPYSSQPGVKPYLRPTSEVAPADACLRAKDVIDLTARLDAAGRLVWDAPAGEWTIVRFGRTLTGQTTRPAPAPGLGFECDKLDAGALDAHFAAFVETLLRTTGEPAHPGRGLTTLHFDSWEMSSQNWSPRFRAEFSRRRGYDPLPYLPALLGRAVDSAEVSERFLWDLRRTAAELVVSQQGERLRELAHQHKLVLDVEPYDLNPAGDLALGAVADVPMCEFWSRGFDTRFSVFEAASAAHTGGRPIVAAEAFTSSGDAWRLHPGALKELGDWALCAGVNRFVFHRFAHQPEPGKAPGMTFGPYGVHWDGTQTWWNLADGYHTYLSRCQALLRRGLPVADILYLDAEGAPNVFRAPASATLPGYPDHRGHSFDGCAPDVLLARASARNGRIVFPDGMSYRLLVLPRLATMTPALLAKVKALAEGGVPILGAPPARSPSLSGFPACDAEVRRLAAEVWKRPNVVADTPLAEPGTANPVAAARWIWFPEGQPQGSAPVARRWFRVEFDLPSAPAAASIAMTADNAFTLTVNGHAAGGGDNFHQLQTMDVTAWLRAGRNELLVAADNVGETPNPAGLLGALTARLAAGAPFTLVTDGQWQSAQAADGPWRGALDLGRWDMGPWGLNASPAAPELYPSYDAAAALLAKLGVAPDFAADADLRYSHRRDGDTDIYLVGNRTAQPVAATARFRVPDGVPEVWDAQTGERRALPEHQSAGGLTSVPLRFEPGQTLFVIFRRGAARPAAGPNFPTWATAAELGGPWQVTFDPRWGGPAAPLTFARLTDWTQQTDDGVRHYSGEAVYRQSFDLPAGPPAGRSALALGEVRHLAAVRLNGRDLGVVWCPPWRLPLPAGLLRATGNQIEVRVANLWCNRLIKDAGLPAGQRLTSTTWNPYKPTDALDPSGLLGPVRLLTAAR